MPSRQAILDAARHMIGTRYRPRGRDTESVDCIGLVAITAGLANTKHDVIGYRPESAYEGQLREHLERVGFALIPVEDMRSGDLVTFHAPSSVKVERHAGIVDGDGFIHVTQDTRKVIRSGLDGRWGRMLHAAYRFPGVSADG